MFCGNPISSCEYVKVPPGNECIIPVAPWHPVDLNKGSVYCSSAVTAPVIVESCVNGMVAKSNESPLRKLKKLQ